MKIEINQEGKGFQSLTLKLGILVVLGLFLLVPLQMIRSVILERQTLSEQVIAEIATQWASRQVVAGPVLNIPVRSIPVRKEEKPEMMVWHILPHSLNVNGSLDPEIRYRSIYKAVVYHSRIEMDGEFVMPGLTVLKNYDVLWDEAYFTIGITDNRGLKGKVVLHAGENDLDAIPGVRDQDLFSGGISFPYPLSPSEGRFGFRTSMDLSGSEGLFLVPLGNTTHVRLASAWKDPGFHGNFLPSSRTVDETGFTADWEITSLNLSFPSSWLGNQFQPAEGSFGVDLVQPVDHYQKAWRGVRYGILFIALTFLVLIVLELTRKEPIPVFHYVLVSLGLVLFFSLLNSLSEHLGFPVAYLISSLVTIGLISVFIGSLFHSFRTGLIVLGMLLLLYAFMYILLSLKDYAYLAGNIGLFVLLAIVMYLAVRMDLFKRSVT